MNRMNEHLTRVAAHHDEMGFRVTLIDISEGMLSKARDNAIRLGLEQLIDTFEAAYPV